MNRFTPGLFWHTLLLALALLALCYGGLAYGQWWVVLPLLGVAVWQFVRLLRYVTGLNRKLTRFLESVQYSDFSIRFSADDPLGPSFQAVNEQFNTVLQAFRQSRAENEANLHYLNSIVQHLGVGLLTVDRSGHIELSNPMALQLLGVYRLRHLNDLTGPHPQLPALIQAGQPVSYRVGEQQTISLRPARIHLRGRQLLVVSLQNIQSELQEKELEAWQNLTRVLRHEIMNSLTPIVSLTDTMQTIVSEVTVPDDALSDLTVALTTIGQRSRSLMQFVDGYRIFTALPQPVLGVVVVEDLLRRIVALVQPTVQQQGVRLTLEVAVGLSPLQADAGQVEMVLLNLLRNAMDALEKTKAPHIRLTASSQQGRLLISVADNGPGISPDTQEAIFIPFYTTKKTGMGIGLSLSRQIMQRHGGTLTAQSAPNGGSVFVMGF